MVIKHRKILCIVCVVSLFAPVLLLASGAPEFNMQAPAYEAFMGQELQLSGSLYIKDVTQGTARDASPALTLLLDEQSIEQLDGSLTAVSLIGPGVEQWLSTSNTNADTEDQAAPMANHMNGTPASVHGLLISAQTYTEQYAELYPQYGVLPQAFLYVEGDVGQDQGDQQS